MIRVKKMNTLNDWSELRELLRKLVRKLGGLDKTQFSCCGITLAQCHTLVEIGRAGTISLNDLSEKLGLDNTTLSRTVNNLVQEELATRSLNQKDHRYVNITLTSKGYDLFENIETNMDQYYQRIMESIPFDKRNQIIESLSIILQSMEQNPCYLNKGVNHNEIQC